MLNWIIKLFPWIIIRRRTWAVLIESIDDLRGQVAALQQESRAHTMAIRRLTPPGGMPAVRVVPRDGGQLLSLVEPPPFELSRRSIPGEKRGRTTGVLPRYRLEGEND